MKDRPDGDISEHKAPFAHPHTPMKELNEIVKELKPTVLIGAAAVPKVCTARTAIIRFIPGGPNKSLLSSLQTKPIHRFIL